MGYAEAFVLIIDAYERFKDQRKYFGPKNVDTLMKITIGIYARTSEEEMRNKLAKLSEWF